MIRVMKNFNEELRNAAKNGADVELDALLLNPGCDALSKDKHGMTALMFAARHGDEGSVPLLLLPASDALSKDKDGLTESALAQDKGHENIARLIEVYVLVPIEKADIEDAARPAVKDLRVAFRM